MGNGVSRPVGRLGTAPRPEQHRGPDPLLHWRSGEMALRWTAAGMLEAERQFRRVVGYRDLPKLLVAIERERHGREEAPMIEAA